MKRVFFTMLAMLTVSLAPAPAAPAPPTFPRPSENIALHKTYTLSPTPGYRYCADPGDRTQLTDGVYSKGYFWTQKETVGWQKVRPAIVTIDLGKIQPIRGASFNTAAGKAGVHWPQAIFLVVSDDKKTWREAGELLTLDLAHGRPSADYEVHRFWTAGLRTHGRWVAVVVAAVDYAFVDEIEIYKGEDAWLAQPLAGEVFASPAACYKAGAQRQCVQRRLREDLQALRELLDRVRPGAAPRKSIESQLAAIEAALPALLLDKIPADFRAVLPLNEIHRRIFKAQAELWRAAGMATLTAWTRGPYDPLAPVHAPILASKPALELALMQNETRAAVLNLSNAGAEDLTATMQISGIDPGWIAVHEVQWTDTAAGQPVLAALPAARIDGAGNYLLNLPAGLTRQVWLSVHPPLGGVSPTRPCFVRVSSGLEIPFALRVSPLRFPDRPTLHLGGWDYTDSPKRYASTPENRAALIAHLRAHFVDSPWGSASLLPLGTHGPDGRMTAPPSTAAFDAWLRLWPGARQYLVFASVPNNFGRLKMGSPQFDTAVKEWIAFWAGAVKKRGLRPEQLNVHLVDEPHDKAMDARLLAWARPFKAAASGVRLWMDPTHENPFQADPAMMALADVLCPNRPRFMNTPQYHKYYAEARPPAAELAFYSCSGPARLLDPYAYYRLQAWECWRHGAKGMYYWAFADTGEGSSWNEYAAQRTAYTPLFLDPVSVAAGKQMEAIREGVEDYEYFVMLKDAVEKAEKQGRNGPALKKAKDLLDGGARRVLEAPNASTINWSDAKDRSLADRVRVEILNTLEALN